MKILKSTVLLGLADEVKIRELKTEIEAFQRPLKNSKGRLPKKFEYPKQIIERVIALKSCGLRPSALAQALGLSRPSVDKWLRSKLAKKANKKPLALVRELVIQDVSADRVYVENARILFRTGIIIEIRPDAITENIIRCLNGRAAQAVDLQ